MALTAILFFAALTATDVSVPLVQQNPQPNQPTPFATTVRVRADDRNIVVTFDCTDPAPSRIAVHTMQRDGDMSGDDSVAIVLDTFGDGRTAYYFRVNAAGARADGLIADRELSLDWDGVWSAQVERTPTGWTARLVIPASTLRFQTGTSWRFNAERYVARGRQTLRWSGISLDASLADLGRAGELTGIEQLRQGRGISTTMNGVARDDVAYGPRSSSITGKPGIDAGYNVTPQLGGVVTVNTDFAETEVDSRQINLSRFPLFFPEKRTFFLEGSNHFNFGLGLSGDFIPFYSRRIGLIDGQTVPLDAGLKFLGKEGRWGVDILGAQTGDSPLSQSANLFAGRVTFDAGAHLRLGAIATNGDPGGVQSNHLGGADATWSTTTFRGDKNLLAGGWVAQSGGDGSAGDHRGWGVTLQYPNDLWNLGASISQFGDALDPSLGFLERPGTRKVSWSSQWQPRPADQEHSRVRQYLYEAYYWKYEMPDGRTQTWDGWITPFGADFRNGTHFEVNYTPGFERFDTPFEIANGVVLPAGAYRFDRAQAHLSSPADRSVRVTAGASGGQLYDGHLNEDRLGVNWTSGAGRLYLEADAVADYGHMREGTFVDRVLQFRSVAAFTPDLVVSSYWQYDTDSRQVGLNNRVRWSITPYADLFVVWNRGWNHPLEEGAAVFTPASNQFVVKLRWTSRR
ncbi:MAG TPA: DUF5916 domain-containing protein [Thermoanaerobaculia bacterium]|jgi:hypothetical protein|nr:DUF5916 domain-containing protein [Thermoanaerobaculia bacterium]